MRSIIFRKRQFFNFLNLENLNHNTSININDMWKIVLCKNKYRINNKVEFKNWYITKTLNYKYLNRLIVLFLWRRIDRA